MYTVEQIRKAGIEGEISSIDVDHLITVLIELFGSGISQNSGKPLVSGSLPLAQSRCCGRCDGINDVCVSDMICEIHGEQGCEVCFGKRQ